MRLPADNFVSVANDPNGGRSLLPQTATHVTSVYGIAVYQWCVDHGCDTRVSNPLVLNFVSAVMRECNRCHTVR